MPHIELTLALIRIASGVKLRCTLLACWWRKDNPRAICSVPFWISTSSKSISPPAGPLPLLAAARRFPSDPDTVSVTNVSSARVSSSGSTMCKMSGCRKRDSAVAFHQR